MSEAEPKLERVFFIRRPEEHPPFKRKKRSDFGQRHKKYSLKIRKPKKEYKCECREVFRR